MQRPKGGSELASRCEGKDGQGDDAFELVTTLATLAKLIRNQRHAITTKFPRQTLH
jgi:phage tail sheath gpL-like